LSLGVDDVSNTILISADGETLTQNIVKMLKTLDEASKPSTTVQVLQLKNGVSAKKVGTALKDILGDKAPSGQQADDQGAKREGGQPPQGEGQRGQGRPRERGPE
jgi:type II secretory pathway component GspD/PulD (secretin)